MASKDDDAKAADEGPEAGAGDPAGAKADAKIEATPADVVVEGTPIDLRRVLKIDKPLAKVTYELEELEPGVLEAAVRRAVGA